MLRVRELSLSEGEALSRLVRRTKDVTVMKRAMVILHSHQGFRPPKIAQMVWWSEDWVRRIIKDYNRLGRDALYPKKAPGAPLTFTQEHRQATSTWRSQALATTGCPSRRRAWNAFATRQSAKGSWNTSAKSGSGRSCTRRPPLTRP